MEKNPNKIIEKRIEDIHMPPIQIKPPTNYQQNSTLDGQN